MKIWLMLFSLVTWLPILFAESCGDSPKVGNSTASSWGADEGKQVTYTCANGYRLLGGKKIFIVRLPRSGMHLHPSVKKSQSLCAAVCEDVRKMAESLSCGTNWIETKSMMEMEKLRLEKLKFQLEGRQGNQFMYAKET